MKFALRVYIPSSDLLSRFYVDSADSTIAGGGGGDPGSLLSGQLGGSLNSLDDGSGSLSLNNMFTRAGRNLGIVTL